MSNPHNLERLIQKKARRGDPAGLYSGAYPLKRYLPSMFLSRCNSS